MVDPVNQDAKAALSQIVEKIERLEQEKENVTLDIRELYNEAKSNGFDTKVLRKLISIRKQDIEKVREQEELLDLYKHAVGMV